VAAKDFDFVEDAVVVVVAAAAAAVSISHSEDHQSGAETDKLGTCYGALAMVKCNLDETCAYKEDASASLPL